jgi:hypothetical protein
MRTLFRVQLLRIRIRPGQNVPNPDSQRNVFSTLRQKAMRTNESGAGLSIGSTMPIVSGHTYSHYSSSKFHSLTCIICGVEACHRGWFVHLVRIHSHRFGLAPLLLLVSNFSGSCYFRQWSSRRQQKVFLLITFWRYSYIIFKDKKS